MGHFFKDCCCFKSHFTVSIYRFYRDSAAARDLQDKNEQLKNAASTPATVFHFWSKSENRDSDQMEQCSF